MPGHWNCFTRMIMTNSSSWSIINDVSGTGQCQLRAKEQNEMQHEMQVPRDKKFISLYKLKDESLDQGDGF